MGQEQPFTLNSRGGVVVVVVVVVIVVLGWPTQRHEWLASRPQGKPAKFKGNDNCPFLPSWALFLSKP